MPGRAPSLPDVADAFDLGDLVTALAGERHDFAEFFRSPTGSLSLTVARWPAGSVDDQQPHTEDEVYYVARGRARLTIAEERVTVRPGTVAFVAAGVDHGAGAERQRDLLGHHQPAGELAVRHG